MVCRPAAIQPAAADFSECHAGAHTPFYREAQNQKRRPMTRLVADAASPAALA